jgi:hypothetical protein
VDKECPGTPPRPREARGRRGVEKDFRNKNGGMMGYSRDIVGNDITPWVIIPSISYIYNIPIVVSSWGVLALPLLEISRVAVFRWEHH